MTFVTAVSGSCVNKMKYEIPAMPLSTETIAVTRLAYADHDKDQEMRCGLLRPMFP